VHKAGISHSPGVARHTTPVAVLVVAAAAILAGAFPFILRSSYLLHLLVVTIIFLMLTSSYNLVVGMTGYLSLCQATFFGLGAYVSAILTTQYGTSALIAAAAGALIIGATSVCVGWVVFKQVRGFAFSIVTLGFAITVFTLVNNAYNFTGGPAGIHDIPRPSLRMHGGVVTLVRTQDFYYAGVALLIVVVGILHLIQSSRLGRLLVAIRNNEALASALGVDSFKYKLFAFVVGAVLAGVAGSFYGHYFTVVTPDILWIYWITAPLTMLIIGGPGSLVGVSIATILLVLIPEALGAFEAYRQLLYGLLLVASIRFMPQGIGGFIDRAVYMRRLSRWRSSLSQRS